MSGYNYDRYAQKVFIWAAFECLSNEEMDLKIQMTRIRIFRVEVSFVVNLNFFDRPSISQSKWVGINEAESA
jgi:hypothetical protein